MIRRFFLLTLALAALSLFLAAPALVSAQFVSETNQQKWIASPPPAPVVDNNGKHRAGQKNNQQLNLQPQLTQITTSLVRDAAGNIYNKVKVNFRANYPNNNNNKKNSYRLNVNPTPAGMQQQLSKDGDDVQYVGLPNGAYQFSISNLANGQSSPLSQAIPFSGATTVQAPAVTSGANAVSGIVDPNLAAALAQVQAGQAVHFINNGIQVTPSAAPVITGIKVNSSFQRRGQSWTLVVSFNAAGLPAGFAPSYMVSTNTGLTIKGTSSPIYVPNLKAGTFAVSVTDLNYKVSSAPAQASTNGATVINPVQSIPAVPQVPQIPQPVPVLGAIPAVTSVTTSVNGLTQVFFSGAIGAVDYTAYASVVGSNLATAVVRGATNPLTFTTVLPVGSYNILIQANMAGGVAGTVSAVFPFTQLSTATTNSAFYPFNLARIDSAEDEDEVMAAASTDDEEEQSETEEEEASEEYSEEASPEEESERSEVEEELQELIRTVRELQAELKEANRPPRPHHARRHRQS